jgi:dienelactone hydrolase
LFDKFISIKRPVLVLYGEYDEYCYGSVPKCIELLKTKVVNKPNFTFDIISGAEHGVNGKEMELARIVAGWLNC